MNTWMTILFAMLNLPLMCMTLAITYNEKKNRAQEQEMGMGDEKIKEPPSATEDFFVSLFTVGMVYGLWIGAHWLASLIFQFDFSAYGFVVKEGLFALPNYLAAFFAVAFFSYPSIAKRWAIPPKLMAIGVTSMWVAAIVGFYLLLVDYLYWLAL